MKIKEIFATRIQEKIEPVVKVGDMDNDSKIANELGSYVITPSIERFLDRFFDHYTDTFYQNTDEIGVWIAGYFGSGKSYLAKIIALLAENRIVDSISAVERFATRIDNNSPYGPGLSRHLSTLKNVNTDIYAFNINTLADSIHSHLAKLLLSYYYHTKGYSSNIIYAHVIERELDKRGKITELHQTIEEISGESWEDIRTNPTFYRKSFYEAACKIAPEAFTQIEDVEAALKTAVEGQAINVQTLVEILLEDLQTQEERLGKRTRIMFVLDEMGQWIGDNGDKIYQLQAFAEEVAKEGRGKIWLTVTTHEDMSTIIETAIKIRPDTKKIESRFQHRFSLTTENIELVLLDRVLKKNVPGKIELERIYNINSGMLRGIGQLADSTLNLPECDLDNFVKFYPFLPYHIHIIPDIVKSLRSQGGRGEQLSGSTRTLLAITQDIIRTGRRPYLDLGVGALITFDEVYENLASDGEINPEIRKDIRDIEKEVPLATEFTRKVAEVLFLVRDLPYVNRTSDNISRLLIETVDQDLTKIKPRVEEELKRLINAEIVSQAGNEYEFLTGERRNFEREVRIVRNQIRHQDRQKGVSQFASQAIGFKTIEYLNKEFDIKTSFDESPVNTKGAIEIKFYSPYTASTGLGITELEERSLRHDQTHTIYILSDKISNFDSELNYYLAMSEVIQAWKGDSNKTQYERTLATDRERKELEKIRQSIIGMLNKGLGNCHIIHKGQSRTIISANQKASITIRGEVAKFWPTLYERFKKVPIKLRNEKRDILDVLVGNTRLSNEVKNLKLYDSSNQVNVNAPLLDELRIFLATQEINQIRTTGKTLLEKFSNTPYGWDQGVVRVGIAVLVRNGNLLILINRKRYENPNDSQLKESLSNLNSFNKVEIELVEIDIPLEMLIKTRKVLIRITGNKKIEETISGITEAFESHGSRIIEKTKLVEIWAGPAGYPLPDLFKESKDKIQEILLLPNNARTVDEVHNNLELIEKGSKIIDDISDFQGQKGSMYLDLKSHYDEVSRIEHKLEQGSNTKQFIENFESAKTQKNICDPSIWRDLHQSKQGSSLEITIILKKWKLDTENLIRKTIGDIPSLLADNGVDENRSHELETQLVTFLENNISETEISRIATLPERAKSQVSSIHNQVLNMIPVIEPKSPIIKMLEHVSVAKIFLGRRISDEKEWVSLLMKLDEKVKEILRKGNDVEIS
jgi:hypothetical protein